MITEPVLFDDPHLLQHAMSPMLEISGVNTSKNNWSCLVNTMSLSPYLSLVWGRFTFCSGIWSPKGIYITISADQQAGFFYNGELFSNGTAPLNVSITHTTQEADFSFTQPYKALVLFVHLPYFEKVYSKLTQAEFGEVANQRVYTFKSQAAKTKLLNLILPITYGKKARTITSSEGHDLSLEIIETLISGIDFHKNIFSDRRYSQNIAMQAHLMILASPKKHIPLSEHCRIFDVPARTLQKGFKLLYGIGITEYHRMYRLHQIRETIHASKHKLKLQELIKEYDFHHPGRFSSMYFDAFGVYPSRDHDWQKLDILFQ